MPSYKVTVTHTFEVACEDIHKVIDTMEYTDFPYANEFDFVEGSTEYEKIGE